jgi:hypothetical protein
MGRPSVRQSRGLDVFDDMDPEERSERVALFLEDFDIEGESTRWSDLNEVRSWTKRSTRTHVPCSMK